MADPNSETSIPMQQAIPQENHQNSLGNTTTRRGFLNRALVAIGLAGLGALANKAGAFDAVANTPAAAAETARAATMSEQQKQALELFKNTSPEKRAHNLIVGSDGAYLRRIPSSFSPEKSEMVPIGKLEPNTNVEEALVVLGNDPNNPTDVERKTNWYFIPEKNEAGEYKLGSFSHSGNFRVTQPPQNP